RRHTRSYGDWSSDVCSSDLVFNDAVDGFGRDGGEVAFTEGPFLPHEASGFPPVGPLKSDAHALGNLGNSLETLLHGALAPDLRFENFPVVDAMLAGLARIADHHAALQLIKIDAKLDAMLTAGRQLNRSGTAKG